MCFTHEAEVSHTCSNSGVPNISTRAMQVSTREQDFVVDTLALRDEMHLLLPILTDPALTKVMHGADSDMRWLEHDFGLYVVNLFDTGQVCVR